MKRLIALAALIAATAAQSAAGPVLMWINGNNPSATVTWPGGIGVFAATSSGWNGATVTLEWIAADGATAIVAGTSTTCTSNCNGVFYLPTAQIKTVVSGGTPTALYAAAYVVQDTGH